ncbi:uncharacterized protein BDZ99DRAFT_294761 [Mytilinidion resinicola]|uniref:Uncharacterized protein n=1 Tax=Mytilinidion resinicola TaxID=574789 RepID=A0A6A6YRB7_9PEZI|nr:uncharacterized protein BDZ99DRAFT_294761 [Mytilinidion resinicola]KAF2811069.1 hypothetical protein BDZ99DRAFT_294761 [Mytilinidion resinicola]
MACFCARHRSRATLQTPTLPWRVSTAPGALHPPETCNAHSATSGAVVSPSYPPACDRARSRTLAVELNTPGVVYQSDAAADIPPALTGHYGRGPRNGSSCLPLLRIACALGVQGAWEVGWQLLAAKSERRVIMGSAGLSRRWAWHVVLLETATCDILQTQHQHRSRHPRFAHGNPLLLDRC